MQATLALVTKVKGAAPFAAGVKAAPLTADTPLHLLVAVVPLGRDIRECEEVRVAYLMLKNNEPYRYAVAKWVHEKFTGLKSVVRGKCNRLSRATCRGICPRLA